MVWNPINVFKSGKDLFIGTPLQSELEQKYGELLGLNPQGAAYVIREFFAVEFARKFWDYILK
jgi:hypothetical protein